MICSLRNITTGNIEIRVDVGVPTSIGRDSLEITDTRCNRRQGIISLDDSGNVELDAIGSFVVGMKGVTEASYVVKSGEKFILYEDMWIALVPAVDTRYSILLKSASEPDKDAKRDDNKLHEGGENQGNKKPKLITSITSSSTTTSTQSSKSGKRYCKYGKDCYQKNAEHLSIYTHTTPSSPKLSSPDPPSPTTTPQPTIPKKVIEKSEAKYRNPFLEETKVKDKVFKSTSSKAPSQPEILKGFEDEIIDDDEQTQAESDKEDSLILDIFTTSTSTSTTTTTTTTSTTVPFIVNGISPLNVMKEGEFAVVKGSSEWKMKYTSQHYYCTCPAWKNQAAAVTNRTCKHLRAYLGETYETARLGRDLSLPAPLNVKSAVPDLLLANKWEEHISPVGFWVSEKLDGVRAFWDGNGNLVSRLGNIFPAPKFITEQLPIGIPLDGELWLGRKKFQQCVSIVKSAGPLAEENWKKVVYQVFDAPQLDKPVEARFEFLRKHFSENSHTQVNVIETELCISKDYLIDRLNEVTENGGEGLMLRKAGSMYQGGRNSTLLKVKTFSDDEAKVIQHEIGKGKNSDRLGALRVKLKNGKEFCVGSGFKDVDRENPPPIGSIINFRYQELTDGGIPRFPIYHGTRDDVTW